MNRLGTLVTVIAGLIPAIMTPATAAAARHGHQGAHDIHQLIED
jgi:hypothetical protein